MSTDSPPDRSMDALLLALSRNNLKEGERAALEENLQRDPDACRVYLDYLFVDALLRYQDPGAKGLPAIKRNVPEKVVGRSRVRFAGWVAALAASLVLGLAGWWIAASGTGKDPDPKVSEWVLNGESVAARTLAPGWLADGREATVGALAPGRFLLVRGELFVRSISTARDGSMRKPLVIETGVGTVEAKGTQFLVKVTGSKTHEKGEAMTQWQQLVQVMVLAGVVTLSNGDGVATGQAGTVLSAQRGQPPAKESRPHASFDLAPVKDAQVLDNLTARGVALSTGWECDVTAATGSLLAEAKAQIDAGQFQVRSAAENSNPGKLSIHTKAGILTSKAGQFYLSVYRSGGRDAGKTCLLVYVQKGRVSLINGSKVCSVDGGSILTSEEGGVPNITSVEAAKSWLGQGSNHRVMQFTLSLPAPAAEEMTLARFIYQRPIGDQGPGLEHTLLRAHWLRNPAEVTYTVQLFTRNVDPDSSELPRSMFVYAEGKGNSPGMETFQHNACVVSHDERVLWGDPQAKVRVKAIVDGVVPLKEAHERLGFVPDAPGRNTTAQAFQAVKRRFIGLPDEPEQSPKTEVTF